MTFAQFRQALALLLGRRPTYAELNRARNCYSYGYRPEALAALIQSGREH
jgi:hypothetical protein